MCGFRHSTFVTGPLSVTGLSPSNSATNEWCAGSAAVSTRITAAARAPRTLAARGGSPASHRDERGARLARRDDREYREYLREEQRRQAGCIARRMQRDFHHGLLVSISISSPRKRSGRRWQAVASILWLPEDERAGNAAPGRVCGAHHQIAASTGVAPITRVNSRGATPTSRPRRPPFM